MNVIHRSESQRWVDEHGGYLYRFALTRVRDPSVAEDLVQETFLAALKGSRREHGPTADRRWMVGIIKHKIADYFRRRMREPLDEDRFEERHSDERDFLPDGHWKPELAHIRGWPDQPDELLERKQFWAVLETCLERLSSQMAQVVTLREVDGLETEEICRLLCLSQTNLGVLLHRGRKQLRYCLSARYFGQAQEVMHP